MGPHPLETVRGTRFMESAISFFSANARFDWQAFRADTAQKFFVQNAYHLQKTGFTTEVIARMSVEAADILVAELRKKGDKPCK